MDKTPETLRAMASAMDSVLGPGAASEDVREHAAAWEAELAVAKARIRELEQQRDSARRVARALYAVNALGAGIIDAIAGAARVLAEEARRG